MTLLLCTALISLGGVAGFMLRPVLVAPPNVASKPADDHADDHSGHGDTSIVELLESSMNNMELSVGKFEVRDYFKKIRIPAHVVERIPQSRRRISATIGGRVNKVFVAPGQAVLPGDQLFELRITDEAVSESQVRLLALLTEVDVLDQDFLEDLEKM